VNGMDVLTNSPEESGNGDVTAGLANIIYENEGEFRVIKWEQIMFCHMSQLFIISNIFIKFLK
jgi:hypothetical protein